ncbi:MAG: type II toxin-antitoxin system CcdA family antitoxin [Pseudomonadota bacterium]|nr:type II toxin-antitoxin system CcdA family antitoxin [Pseudomonadota bacterium]
MRTLLIAMPQVSSPAQRKRATNLSLSEDVLADARELNINLSQVCEQHLRTLIRQARERRWLAEHADFVAAYNTTVAQAGLPLDAWKTF